MLVRPASQEFSCNQHLEFWFPQDFGMNSSYMMQNRPRNNGRLLVTTNAPGTEFGVMIVYNLIYKSWLPKPNPRICHGNLVPDIAVEVNLLPDNIEPVPVAVPTVQFDPQMAKSNWYGCVGWIFLGAFKIHEMFLNFETTISRSRRGWSVAFRICVDIDRDP